jgi:Mg2+ and Co2+ transporter CorA
MELESLRTRLRECEAYFAQTEILRFIESNRRKFTPRNIAFAMAGLPRITARVSREQCAKLAIDPPDGIAFEVFRAIARSIREPIRDLRHSVYEMRKRLLNGPQSDLPQAAQLRENWYFLESAIRTAARDTGALPGSLAFRIFARYTENCTSQTAADAVLASVHRLLIDGEHPKRGPLRKSNTERGGGLKD